MGDARFHPDYFSNVVEFNFFGKDAFFFFPLIHS